MFNFKKWWDSPITWGGLAKMWGISFLISLFYLVWLYVKLGLISLEFISEKIDKLLKKETED